MPPQNKDNFDTKYANEPWKDEDSDLMKKQNELVKQAHIQALFEGYYYTRLSEYSSAVSIIRSEIPARKRKKNRNNALSLSTYGSNLNTKEA
mmetsp:Transcript_24132/g.24055  ORF Transcript_24132/g.24055 Transcript_24132/m.24055 type:complete len:92 (-) Transcript_24132:24-299(-)